MAQHYRYRLGVDLGIASIGTALIKLDANHAPTGILDCGTRIFEIPEGGADRRLARQARKTLRRRKQRLRALTRLLQEQGLLPRDTAELALLMRLSPYRLRAHGMHKRLNSPYELGRCLLHIAKFRGASFLNALEESATDEEGMEKQPKDRQKSAKAYRGLEEQLKEGGQSLSEFFRKRIANKQPVRRRAHFVKENLVEYAVPRFLVKEDFARLWNAQAASYPVLSEALRHKVYNCIFADMPHAPYATGKCTLDPDSGENRLPKMHRLAELRRIYEQINNIRLVTANGSEELTKTMRDMLVQQVLAGETLNRTKVKKLIGPLCQHKLLQVNLGEDENAIKAFVHVKAFAGVPHWHTLSEQEQDAVIEFIAEPKIHPEQENSPLLPEDAVLARLCAWLNLGENAHSTAASVVHALPQGRSNLGKTACKAILGKLIAGQTGTHTNEQGQTQQQWKPHSHRSAADACGYAAEEEMHRSMAGSAEYLPYYGQVLRHDVAPVHPWHVKTASPEEAQYGRIPNPVVHVALNQLRKVVNEIIILYGKPHSIVVELARDFGKSAKQREEILSRQLAQKKENEQIDEKLKTIGLPPSRKNRLKYRLWKEQGCQDIYTLDSIGCSELSECEIDHIIPRHAGGSDTYMNMALTRRANAAKSNTFAYEFIQSHCPEKWQSLVKILQGSQYPQQKAWRFMQDAKERFTMQGDEDQTDHRLSDTSYIAKMSKRYLSVLTGDITAVKGSMTANLRHLWGLDGLEYELSGFLVPKELYDAQTGEVLYNPLTGYPERNPQWKGKPRIDHRHHALDALVAACTTRAMVQAVATRERLGKEGIPVFPLPFGENSAAFRAAVLKALCGVRVSPKAEHGTQGQLHDATKYRILAERQKSKKNDYLICYKRKLEVLDTKAKVQGIVFNTSTISLDNTAAKAVYDKTRYQITAIEARYEQAARQLEAEQAEALNLGRKSQEITEKRIVQKAIRLAQQQDKQVGHYFTDLDYKKLVALRPHLQCGHEPQNNFCVDFYEDNQGKIGWECISRFNYTQKNFKPLWQQEGAKLLWRLLKGDVLELTLDGLAKKEFGFPLAEGKYLFVVQKFSENKLQCNLLHDARELQAKDGAARWVSGERGLSSFTKTQARKVELSPFGKVHRKYVKLWHGAKEKKR